jgi:hypothetical protein
MTGACMVLAVLAGDDSACMMLAVVVVQAEYEFP